METSVALKSDGLKLTDRTDKNIVRDDEKQKLYMIDFDELTEI